MDQVLTLDGFRILFHFVWRGNRLQNIIDTES